MSSKVGFPARVPDIHPEWWHLWYDDYDAATVFITEGSYTSGPEPRVVAEGLPYQEGLERVQEHNRSLYSQKEN